MPTIDRRMGIPLYECYIHFCVILFTLLLILLLCARACCCCTMLSIIVRPCFLFTKNAHIYIYIVYILTTKWLTICLIITTLTHQKNYMNFFI